MGSYSVGLFRACGRVLDAGLYLARIPERHLGVARGFVRFPYNIRVEDGFYGRRVKLSPAYINIVSHLTFLSVFRIIISGDYE